MRRSLLALSLVLCSCVDPSQVTGFECDESGKCKPPGGGSTGGGGSTAGGGTGGAQGGGTGGAQGGGTGGAQGGGTGGAQGGGTGGGGGVTCDSTSCSGCCDAQGACQTGNTSAACGVGGACVACGAGERCQTGVCQPLAANGSSCSLGTDCASGFCVGGLCCNGSCSGSCETCSATGSEGRCTPLAEATIVSTCGAYACDGVNGTCPTSCTSTRNCATGRFCDTGRCELLRSQGQQCTANSQCQSGFCADGVCCNSACSGSCDRCNLATSGGTCSPAPANDPGAPACGGSVVCNGTLPDCPILCSSGCPTNTYCSGTYCAAKKPNGTVCGAATECSSNNCVDGVCCDTACAGACDACSVAAGAANDGTCSLLGTTRVCRAAATTCDTEERCNGSSAACPGDSFADAGVNCGSTTYSAWSTCDGGSACATSGNQSRTRTDRACSGTGTCGMSTATETQACTRVTEGNTCGTTTYSAYTACSYAGTCVNSGSRTRTRTDPLCQTGSCAAVQNTETDMAGCARNTDNTSCGTSTYGAYGSCSYASTCAETGSRSRTRTDPVCQTGSCGSTTAMESDTTGCGRTTTGTSCGTTTTGAWGACSYGSTCATSGSRTRTVTTFTCGSGACNSSGMTETDTTGCGRSTSGQSCGTTSYGAWSACSYADACTNSGSRTRSVTTYACDTGGGCAPSTTTETDTTGCARNTTGTSCGATVYGTFGACSYASTCINSGSRSRSMTTYTCSAGACAGSSGTDTDTAGCARNTDGATCGATTCGACSCPLCEKTCTTRTCLAEACTTGSTTQGCLCGGPCAIRAPDPTE